MIRQTIICDICGSEKKHTNHWFIAHQVNGELRLSGWKTKRARPEMKHLCGQKCVHRLLDLFMTGQTLPEPAAPEPFVAAASLPAASAPAPIEESEPFVESARLITPAEVKLKAEEKRPAAPPDPGARYSDPKWRAQVWKRERELSKEESKRPALVRRSRKLG